MTARADVLEARAYVGSRFFPPLPPVYGDLAVQALEAYRGDPEAVIALPASLSPMPRGYFAHYGKPMIRAVDLLCRLHLEHLLDNDD